ncbi:FabD/lysophospholipase-like protein [Paraphaeosphaeria sporulosa]|uniref:FabD/lysophospholipase-like protein n=1 Tax=Paraphaeosphaeria sporulosa TaxID=1460663 RepID=A0A177CUA7_9PLEO|nr:FabD/lysophospholipase-like protein [Paraphaeosphaeria sporulosa]OAG11103.1 FabD/lysophospholipase-like protein [Paraphaeosphaeria sporulosa]
MSSSSKIPLSTVHAKKLLCLDGGGVKGISSLIVLDAIMKRVRELEEKDPDPTQHFPHTYFDLAGGTSTGGLAALMMFRLGMSTAQTMQSYEEMSKKIFASSCATKFRGIFSSMYSASGLEKAIDKVVGKALGVNCDAAGRRTLLLGQPPQKTSEAPVKPLLCSTLVERGETILFRSYDLPNDAGPVTNDIKDVDFSNVTIHEAARATSAAPTYLPEVIIERPDAVSGKPVKFMFWDGGLLNNNPVDQVWDARFDLADGLNSNPCISLVVSIGTSWSESEPLSSWFLTRFMNTISQTMSFVTNTEAKHKDFKRNIGRMNRRVPEEQRTYYFRFNTPTGKEKFELDNWKQMDRLKALTMNYLNNDEKAQKDLEDCARILVRQAPHYPPLITGAPATGRGK